ncbi:MAG: hypothetical protein JW779_10320, partial [Candidatus Thorarchaeota archaeon]|nr:hypothetical protein [Candidatus Thorarchaeota archaeon]
MALNPRYMIGNFLDNQIKTIMSGYAPLLVTPATGKIFSQQAATRLSSEYLTMLPPNVAETIILDIFDGRKDLATALLPWPIGTPEGTIRGIENLIGRSRLSKGLRNWAKGDSPIAFLMEKTSYAHLVQKGLNASSQIEQAARVNIFMQAFDAKLNTRIRPQFVQELRADPNLPPSLIDGIANGTINNPTQFRQAAEDLRKPEVPAFRFSSIAPPATADRGLQQLAESVSHDLEGIRKIAEDSGQTSPHEVLAQIGTQLKLVHDRIDDMVRQAEDFIDVETILPAEYVDRVQNFAPTNIADMPHALSISAHFMSQLALGDVPVVIDNTGWWGWGSNYDAALKMIGRDNIGDVSRGFFRYLPDQRQVIYVSVDEIASPVMRDAILQFGVPAREGLGESPFQRIIDFGGKPVEVPEGFLPAPVILNSVESMVSELRGSILTGVPPANPVLAWALEGSDDVVVDAQRLMQDLNDGTIYPALLEHRYETRGIRDQQVEMLERAIAEREALAAPAPSDTTPAFGDDYRLQERKTGFLDTSEDLTDEEMAGMRTIDVNEEFIEDWVSIPLDEANFEDFKNAKPEVFQRLGIQPPPQGKWETWVYTETMDTLFESFDLISYKEDITPRDLARSIMQMVEAESNLQEYIGKDYFPQTVKEMTPIAEWLIDQGIIKKTATLIEEGDSSIKHEGLWELSSVRDLKKWFDQEAAGLGAQAPVPAPSAKLKFAEGKITLGVGDQARQVDWDEFLNTPDAARGVYDYKRGEWIFDYADDHIKICDEYGLDLGEIPMTAMVLKGRLVIMAEPKGSDDPLDMALSLFNAGFPEDIPVQWGLAYNPKVESLRDLTEPQILERWRANRDGVAPPPPAGSWDNAGVRVLADSRIAQDGTFREFRVQDITGPDDYFENFRGKEVKWDDVVREEDFRGIYISEENRWHFGLASTHWDLARMYGVTDWSFQVQGHSYGFEVSGIRYSAIDDNTLKMLDSLMEEGVPANTEVLWASNSTVHLSEVKESITTARAKTDEIRRLTGETSKKILGTDVEVTGRISAIELKMDYPRIEPLEPISINKLDQFRSAYMKGLFTEVSDGGLWLEGKILLPNGDILDVSFQVDESIHLYGRRFNERTTMDLPFVQRNINTLVTPEGNTVNVVTFDPFISSIPKEYTAILARGGPGEVEVVNLNRTLHEIMNDPKIRHAYSGVATVESRIDDFVTIRGSDGSLRLYSYEFRTGSISRLARDANINMRVEGLGAFTSNRLRNDSPNIISSDISPSVFNSIIKNNPELGEKVSEAFAHHDNSLVVGLWRAYHDELFGNGLRGGFIKDIGWKWTFGWDEEDALDFFSSFGEVLMTTVKSTGVAETMTHIGADEDLIPLAPHFLIAVGDLNNIWGSHTMKSPGYDFFHHYLFDSPVQAEFTQFLSGLTKMKKDPRTMWFETVNGQKIPFRPSRRAEVSFEDSWEAVRDMQLEDVIGAWNRVEGVNLVPHGYRDDLDIQLFLDANQAPGFRLHKNLFKRPEVQRAILDSPQIDFYHIDGQENTFYFSSGMQEPEAKMLQELMDVDAIDADTKIVISDWDGIVRHETTVGEYLMDARPVYRPTDLDPTQTAIWQQYKVKDTTFDQGVNMSDRRDFAWHIMGIKHRRSFAAVYADDRFIWSFNLNGHNPLRVYAGYDGADWMGTGTIVKNRQNDPLYLIMPNFKQMEDCLLEMSNAIPPAMKSQLDSVPIEITVADGVFPEFFQPFLQMKNGRPIWTGTYGEFFGREASDMYAYSSVLRGVQEQAQLNLRSTVKAGAREKALGMHQYMDEWFQRINNHANRMFEKQGARGGGWGNYYTARNAIGKAGRGWANAIEEASMFARGEVARILFDYTYKSKAEELLRYVAPFTTWQLRNPLIWAQIASHHPNMITLASRYYHLSEVERRRRNLTSRFEGTVGTELGEDVVGGTVAPEGYYGVNVSPLMSIFTQFQEPFLVPGEEQFYEDQNQVQKFLQWMIQSGQRIGITPWPWVQGGMEQLGVMPDGSTNWNMGPVQRALELGLQWPEIEALQPGEGLLGDTTTSKWLRDYYVNRRIAEMEAEGLITHEEAMMALREPESEIYQRALGDIRRMSVTTGALSLISPFSVKYASEGELAIREARGLAANTEDPVVRANLYTMYPFLETYQHLFTSDTDLEVARIYLEYDRLIEEQDLRPWEMGYRDMVAERAIRLHELLGDRIKQDKYLSFKDTKAKTRAETFERLAMITPEIDSYVEDSGEINWDGYYDDLLGFYNNVGAISEQIGQPVTFLDFFRYKYRYAKPEEVAYDLYKIERNELWKEMDELSPDAPSFHNTLTWALEQQYFLDLAAGFTPEEASELKLDNAIQWFVEGLPYRWENEIIQAKLDPVNLQKYSNIVALTLGIDPNSVELSTRLDATLPGLYGWPTPKNQAISSLYDYYYGLTPGERDQIDVFLELGERSLSDLSDEEKVKAWMNVAKELFRVDDIFIRNVITPESFQHPVLPPWDDLTPEEEDELNRVRKDWYDYRKTEEAGYEGQWTALMEKYYSNPRSWQTKFWNAVNGQVMYSDIYEDPVLGSILSKMSRDTFEYTEEDYKKALEYFEEHRDWFVNEELTQEYLSNEEWAYMEMTQKDQVMAMRLIEEEATKTFYYSIPWDKREEWRQENPEKWQAIAHYLVVREIEKIRRPFYMYFNDPEDYKRFYGDITPEEAQRMSDRRAEIWNGIFEKIENTVFGTEKEIYEIVRSLMGTYWARTS